MHISVFAIGRMKKGAETELVEFYTKRFAKSAQAVGLQFDGVREVAESRANSAEQRKHEEAQILQSCLKNNSLLVLLDERGKNISSRQFSTQVGKWRDDGHMHLTIALGGPDGFSKELHAQANLLLAFGAMTWPHRLARIMLSEQLYRSALILANHPYHRD